jgi:transposase-like protein
MQRIFDAECSADEYWKQGKDFLFPDLRGELCPQCGKDHLRQHGYYRRYLILTGFAREILIRRYICKECGKTVSLLPSLAHPKRAYGIEPIAGVLRGFYADGLSVGAVAPAGAVCSRQLLRWFRKRIEENLNMLIMGLMEAHRLRAPPVRGKEIRKRVGEFFEYIQNFKAEDISLKIFELNRKTYLSPLSG